MAFFAFVKLRQQSSKRSEREEVDKQQHNHKSCGNNERYCSEEKGESCDWLFRICAGDGKYYADKRNAHSKYIERANDCVGENAGDVHRGYQKRKRCINGAQKTYQCQNETDNQHDVTCFHVGIWLFVLWIFLCRCGIVLFALARMRVPRF